MKMSIEAAMEIWKAGGGVAAAEWQEKAGWKRGYPVYRRRPTPCFCIEYSRRDLEDAAVGRTLAGVMGSSTSPRYWSDILTNITRRFPKVRKIVLVNDPDGLREACEDAKIPMPQRNVDGTWNLGGIIATPEVWAACPSESHPLTDPIRTRHEAEPRYVWQELAKRLATSAVPAS